MKKILACVLAAATVLSLSATAFAYTKVDETKIVDSDGEKISYAKNATVEFDMDNGGMFDIIRPDQTFYIPMGYTDLSKTAAGITYNYEGINIPSQFFSDKSYFTMSTKDKSGDASKLIKITQESSKSIEKQGRQGWLMVEVGNTMTSDELKGTMTLEFKPKKDLYEAVYKFYKNNGTTVGCSAKNGLPELATALNGVDSTLTAASKQEDFEDALDEYFDGEKVKVDMTFWVNNLIEDGTDADKDAGDAFVFNPDSNETNMIVWNTENGERASLKFDADDDASKFYAKLSIKSNPAIYSEYADPVGADLWFYDFVGNTSIPATSRATLTLGIPWNEDDDYSPASPEDCFIYRLVDGELQDVTKNFTYNSDGDIDGWSTRTRELGTFIVSDMELDIEVAGAVEEPVVSTPATTDKVIPNTGSSDMVNVAVVAAVVSLAAAGAVAFRKVK